jgi:hypothetical protein
MLLMPWAVAECMVEKIPVGTQATKFGAYTLTLLEGDTDISNPPRQWLGPILIRNKKAECQTPAEVSIIELPLLSLGGKSLLINTYSGNSHVAYEIDPATCNILNKSPVMERPLADKKSVTPHFSKSCAATPKAAPAKTEKPKTKKVEVKNPATKVAPKKETLKKEAPKKVVKKTTTPPAKKAVSKTVPVKPVKKATEE